MVTIESSNRKNHYEFKIQGHAEYNPGNDIVCAGISALTFTLAQSLINMQERNAFYQLDYRLDKGNAWIRADVRPPYMQEMNTVVETILTGYIMMESRYPDHVKLDLGWEKLK